jgi:hypothetical protein
MSTRELVTEMVLDFILNHYDYKKINSHNDIIRAVEYHEDAVEDIKERLWEVIKYEIKFRDILDEIEKRKQLEEGDEDIEEEEDQTNSSDSEEDD